MTAREVSLSRGLVALVDETDYESVVAAGPWHASVRSRTAYAMHHVRRSDGTKTKESLHSFLTGWRLVDHRNGDGLDNQRANLRPATRAENVANSPTRATNTSGFKGVSWHKQRGRWTARIRRGGGETRHLGLFDSAIEAARAYDAAARSLFGEFARPNFPQECSR